jgi:type II secretory pathway component PulF
MSQETTNAGMQGDWKRLVVAIEANAAELGHLEVPRVKLGGLLAQAEEINKQHKALTASKLEASRQLKLLMTEGQRLSNALRTMLREHYGIRAEKLAEFGLQPFRGRNRKSKKAPAEPTPTEPTPTDPTNPVR